MALAVGETRTSLATTVSASDLDATWLLPDEANAVVVFAHGAGADHRHANMSGIAEALCAQKIATLRFNFPFMQPAPPQPEDQQEGQQEGQQKSRRRARVDRPEVATACIAAACEYARATTSLPMFVGGHSFGGRMATHAVAEHGLDCRGLILCSFPLHPAKKQAPKKVNTARAEHLDQILQPMLFLSGTRDDLADAELLTGVVDKLPNAKLHWLDTANHSYVPLKRQRTHPLSVFDEMAAQARGFVESLI